MKEPDSFAGEKPTVAEKLIHVDAMPQEVGPGRFKVDSDLPVEILAGILVVIPGGFMMLITVLRFMVSTVEIPSRKYLTIMGVSSVFLVLGLCVWWFVEACYIFDVNKKRILIHRRIFGRTSESTAYTFSQIRCIIIHGSNPAADQPGGPRGAAAGALMDKWVYHVAAVLDDGKTLMLSTTQTDFHLCSVAGSKIAGLIGMEFTPGVERRCTLVDHDRATGQVQIRQLKKEEYRQQLKTESSKDPHELRNNIIGAVLLLLIVFLISLGMMWLID